MRVLVLDSYYPAFWRGHYGERPGLAESSYAEQLESLMSRWFGTSDAYSHHLRQSGHDAREIVVNCLPLQAAWAREHGIRGLTTRTLLMRVLLAQIAEYDPDVVYLQDLAGLWGSVRRRLRASGRLLVAQIASAPPRDVVLRDCDLVLTSFPHWVPRLRERGIDCEYVPLAFDERVLDAVGGTGERRHEVSFVGTLSPDHYRGGAQGALERACDEVPVAVWGSGADALRLDSPILRDYRGQAWGLDMYRILHASRVVLNRHHDVAEGHANNMRMYEATGMGAVLVTEAAPNLPELLAPGEEVVVYEGPEDLVAKLEWLRRDDDERLRIARAGHRRTLADHTYARRIPRIAELLEARLN